MLDGPKPTFPSSVAITTPEDARRAVDDLKQGGADFIKLQSLIPRDAVFAIAEEAKKQDIPFEGHVPDSVRASEMSNAGMHSFEHLIGIFEGSSPLEDEFLKGGKPRASSSLPTIQSAPPPSRDSSPKIKPGNVPRWFGNAAAILWTSPTSAKTPAPNTFPPTGKTTPGKSSREQVKTQFNTEDLATRQTFVAKELEVVQLLHNAGVPFLAGTDTPPGVYIFPGFSLHEELQRFVAAGFTPLEALQTATLNPAIFFHMESDMGTVEKGKFADLVLLEANPLQDIRNTQKIAAVIVDGHYLGRADLQKILDKVENTANQEPPKQKTGTVFQ